MLTREAVKAGAEQAKGRGREKVLSQLVEVGRGEAKRVRERGAGAGDEGRVVGSAKAEETENTDRGDANTSAPQAERSGGLLIVEASKPLAGVAVLDLYVRESVRGRERS